LTCKHLFHRACVDEWLHVNASCPTCRDLLFPPNPNHPHQPANAARMETEVAGANGTGLEMLESQERSHGVNDNNV